MREKYTLETPYTSYSTKCKRKKNNKNEKERLYISQKRKCRWCGKFCKKTGNGGTYTEFTVDHVIPVKVGGTNHWMNLVGSCHKCNNGRNRKWCRIDRIEI